MISPLPSELDGISIRHKLQQFATEIHLVIPESAAEIWAEIAKLEQEALITTAKLGLLLIKLKFDTPHGQFTNELEDRNISQSAAKDAMAIADMLLKIPETKRQTSGVLTMNKSQLIEMARLPPAVLENMEEGKLQELITLPSRQVAAEVRAIKKEYEQKELAAQQENQLVSQNQHLVNSVNDLNQALLSNPPVAQFGYPPLIVKIRKEAIVHTELLNNSLEMIALSADQVCGFNQFDPAHTLAAAQALAHTLAGLAMQIGNVLTRLDDTFGNKIKGIDAIPGYTPSEWDHLEPDRLSQLEVFKLNFAAKMETN